MFDKMRTLIGSSTLEVIPNPIIPDVLNDGTVRDWTNITTEAGAGATPFILGNGTLQQLGVTYGNTASFGKILLSEHPEFIKYALEFRSTAVGNTGYDVLRSSAANLPSGQNSINAYVHLGNSTILGIYSESGSLIQRIYNFPNNGLIRIECQIGKIEVFVNNVSRLVWTDPSITFNTIISSFKANANTGTFNITEIKEILYTS